MFSFGRGLSKTHWFSQETQHSMQKKTRGELPSSDDDEKIFGPVLFMVRDFIFDVTRTEFCVQLGFVVEFIL